MGKRETDRADNAAKLADEARKHAKSLPPGPQKAQAVQESINAAEDAHQAANAVRRAADQEDEDDD